MPENGLDSDQWTGWSERNGDGTWNQEYLRFMTKVERRDTHWVWTGGVGPDGYARYHARTDRGFVTCMAHKFLYQKRYGLLSRGVRLTNRCGMRSCVNPYHWFVPGLDAVS